MKIKFICLAILSLVAVLPAMAQNSTADLAWDAVSGDIEGYTVFWGTEPGVYSNNVEVGLVTETVLTGLTDCQPLYFCVRARKADGTLSANCSNEVDGWGAPQISEITPGVLEQGFTGDLIIDGLNYMEGAVFGVTPGQGVAINSVSRNSCNQLVANVTVAVNATVGPLDTEVLNPDRIWTGWVVGQLEIITPAAPPVPENLRRTEIKPEN